MTTEAMELRTAGVRLEGLVMVAHQVTERLTDRMHDLAERLAAIALMDAPVAERERLLREFLREFAYELDGPNTDEPGR